MNPFGLPIGSTSSHADPRTAHQSSSPAPNHSAAARMEPEAMSPKSMYRRPVADSIDRVRAVWTAAHVIASGSPIPTMKRNHTKRAAGPTSGSRGGGPALAPGRNHLAYNKGS